MKTTQYMLALALAVAPSAAFADSSAAKATFTLTETKTDPALQKKDSAGKPIKGGEFVYENEYSVETTSKSVSTYEYGSKMKVSKISNKEILEALVRAAVIPAITGWSIVFVESDDDESDVESDEDGASFAVTDGTEYKLLDDYISIELGGESETSNRKSVTTTTSVGIEMIETQKETESSNGKALIFIGFDVDDIDVNLSGIASWSGMLKSLGKGDEAYTQWIGGPIKISAISGERNYPEVEGDSESSYTELNEDTVIEGSISTATAKPIER